MTEPEHRVDDFERALLTSAKNDGLRPDRKAAMALALGIGAGGAVAGVAGVAKAAGAAGAATKAKVAASVIVMKWLAVAAVGGAVVVGATTLKRASEPEAAVQASEPASPTAPARVAPGPARLATAAAVPTESDAPIAAPAPSASAPVLVSPVIARPVVAVAAVPKVEAAPSAAPAAQPEPEVPAASPRAPAAILADEQRTIERARVALAAGDVVGARRALDEHDAAFANGAFAAESELLRIDARARAGDHEGAARAARAVLARSPSSPYAARLRALAAEAPAAP